MTKKKTAPVLPQRTVAVVVPKDVQMFFAEVEVSGHGGFQALCRTLSERLKHQQAVEFTTTEFARIVRYATVYGDGGFQARLRKIVVHWVAQHFEELMTHG